MVYLKKILFSEFVIINMQRSTYDSAVILGHPGLLILQSNSLLVIPTPGRLPELQPGTDSSLLGVACAVKRHISEKGGL